MQTKIRIDERGTTNEGRRTRDDVRSGFTLVELMVAVTIMTVIVYALYQMFNQTQKALRANITQVDVLESGRAASEMLSRELAQMAPCHLDHGTNIYARTIPIPPLVLVDADGKTPLFTNHLEEIFFLTSITNSWVGNGYLVTGADNGVGTLYRFSAWTNNHGLTSQNLAAAFQNATNLALVADGVVHFRVQPYDPEGRLLSVGTTNLYAGYQIRRTTSSGQRLPASSEGTEAATTVWLSQDFGGETRFAFLSNALPAYVDLELGVLEPQTYHEYLGLAEAPPQVARDFLKRQSGHIHLFRKRIPIRTTAP